MSPAAADQQPPMSSTRLRLLRLLTLTSLLLTDGTYTILRRYSRGVLLEKYSANEVLLAAEWLKLGLSCFMMSGACSGGGDKKSQRRPLPSHLLHLLLKSRKMLLLALLYGIGNVLSYYALARVSAGTFVVIANLKTLTTAGFSAAILGRRYSWTRWRALVLLVAGVVLFVLPTLKRGEEEGGVEEGGDDDAEEASGEEDEEDAAPAARTLSSSLATSAAVLGIAAEIVVVTLSGFASIYFEKAIKQDPFNIWERNFQLGFYSVLMYLMLMWSKPSPPFEDWTPLAVVLSCLGATGGLLVALSIKYGDSVLKTLAHSGSVIYASVVDHVALGGPLNEQMGLAAVVVVIAVLNYNFDATPVAADSGPQMVVASPQKSIPRGKDEEDGWGKNEEMRPMVKTRSSSSGVITTIERCKLVAR